MAPAPAGAALETPRARAPPRAGRTRRGGAPSSSGRVPPPHTVLLPYVQPAPCSSASGVPPLQTGTQRPAPSGPQYSGRRPASFAAPVSLSDFSPPNNPDGSSLSASGHEHCSVPLWEREFCSYVGNISWHRFCENKQYVSVYNNLEQWDDSGAFENFQNSKARFWANYHGQPSGIPLPDPDMYIDKVDHLCKVDPELVADLDKVRLPFDSDYSSTLATGSDNAGADNKCTQNRSGNWDIYIEKPAEVNKWDWDANAIWGGKDESSSKWGNSNSGWGASLEEPSWRGWSNNQYASKNRNNTFYGGSNNSRYREEDPSHASGRKRNHGGYFQQRNNKQRNQDEGHHQRSSWQDHRGRNRE